MVATLPLAPSHVRAWATVAFRSSIALSWSIPCISLKALSHCAWPASGSSSHALLLAPEQVRADGDEAHLGDPVGELRAWPPFTPKISWIITTAPAGFAFGMAT